MERNRLSLLALLLPAALSAQTMTDGEALDQMRYDVQYLASDRLEGREAGTPGEKLAVDYVVAKYGNVGLMPYGDSATYLQASPSTLSPCSVLPTRCSRSAHLQGEGSPPCLQQQRRTAHQGGEGLLWY